MQRHDAKLRVPISAQASSCKRCSHSMLEGWRVLVVGLQLFMMMMGAGGTAHLDFRSPTSPRGALYVWPLFVDLACCFPRSPLSCSLR